MTPPPPPELSMAAFRAEVKALVLKHQAAESQPKVSAEPPRQVDLRV